jgi:hypothetical protein
VSRICARPGCTEGAVATLTYDYQARTGWLDDLASEKHPMSYDLCLAHAGALTVPRGWELEDRRVDPGGGGPRRQGALAS